MHKEKTDFKEVIIRQCKDLHEFKQCEEIQKIVWRLPDNTDCIPDHMMLAAVEAGGVVLGAENNGVLVGYLFAILAYQKEAGLYHHSHIMGVLPEYQGKGIGEKLKRVHRRIALERGIKKVAWTFDPLLLANAKLNISKLGAICRNYRINVYGEVMGGSELTGDIPSDRFYAEWFLDSKRVVNKMDKENLFEEEINRGELHPVNTTKVSQQGYILPESYLEPSGEKLVLLEIPANFQTILDSNKSLARRWRFWTRDVFENLFLKGYTCVDIVAIDEKKAGYIFQKNFSIE